MLSICSLKGRKHFQFKALCSSKMCFFCRKVVLPYFKCWSMYFFKSVLKDRWHFFRSVTSWQIVRKGINSPYTNGWWNESSVMRTPLVLYQFPSRGRYLQNRSRPSYTKRSHSSAAKRWIDPVYMRLWKMTPKAQVEFFQHQLRHITVIKGKHVLACFILD